ncbi:hypothetical protein J6590_026127 [Homalodisca vitripennis]|nr:hypothetical protein J6590_026127 [Homalodisca vitripennis]
MLEPTHTAMFARLEVSLRTRQLWVMGGTDTDNARHGCPEVRVRSRKWVTDYCFLRCGGRWRSSAGRALTLVVVIVQCSLLYSVSVNDSDRAGAALVFCSHYLCIDVCFFGQHL